METKIEVLISPQAAGELAVESYNLSLAQRGRKPSDLTGLIAILFGFIGFCLFGDSPSSMTKLVSALIGAGIGVIAGIELRSSVRSKIARQAAAGNDRSGPKRTIEWDSDFFTTTNAMVQTRFRWEFIDEIKNAEIGIHLLSGGRPIYGIPKAVLPPSINAEELVKAWQSCRRPPQFK